MNEVEKDILSVQKGVILQQVNCRGVMGAGLAGAIAKKWPEVLTSYIRVCSKTKPRDLLGHILLIQVNQHLAVANAFGQLDYGRGIQYTDYGALDSSLGKLSRILEGKRDVYVPFGLGCGLGGGDWAIVSNIVSRHLPTAIVCRLPER